MIGLDDFGKEADDAPGDATFTAALALAHGELAEEVFVDAPEGVVVHRGGNLRDFLEQVIIVLLWRTEAPRAPAC